MIQKTSAITNLVTPVTSSCFGVCYLKTDSAFFFFTVLEIDLYRICLSRMACDYFKKFFKRKDDVIGFEQPFCLLHFKPPILLWYHITFSLIIALSCEKGTCSCSKLMKPPSPPQHLVFHGVSSFQFLETLVLNHGEFNYH